MITSFTKLKNLACIKSEQRQTNIPANIDNRLSNALVETLLIKLGDNALYVLFASYRKNRTNTASRSIVF